MSTDPLNPGWRQLDLTCTDWRAAEHMATTRLGPLLNFMEATGVVFEWWFVREGDTWRVRVRPRIGSDDDLAAMLATTVTTLTDVGSVLHARETTYEPETTAFGGHDAMHVGYALFHADSSHLLEHLAVAETDHRHELGLILASRLMTAAGLGRYEQGDVWSQVATHRLSDSDPDDDITAETLTAVGQLITATADTESSPLRAAPQWPTAFQTAGRRLADLNSGAQLTRELGAVLTHHILFTFNRHGISARDQHRLALAAAHIIFQENFTPDPTATSGTPGTTTVTVGTVTDQPTDLSDTDPDQLRHGLAEEIRRWNAFHTPLVETAFRSVPRHLFLPGVDLATAYANKPVVTKRDSAGNSISSASSPMLVAAMLEQLDVQAGHHVLEIGTATGFNAALLAHLVGPSGTVVTIELDADLIEGARHGLDQAGYPNVEVICGDGALGHQYGAPYERIIVTAEAWDISPHWWEQLAPGGRLVLPLRLHGSGLTRALGFTHTEPDRMIAASAEVCGFVPMRGSSEHHDGHITLADDILLKFDLADQPDTVALADALTYPAQTTWSGVEVDDIEAAQHLDLWLLTTAGHSFGRLSIESAARARGAVDPARRWGGATLYTGGTIAYLTARPVTDTRDELGVIAHGPDSADLATHLTDLLHRWDTARPTQPTITAHRITRGDMPPAADEIARPETRLTVEWTQQDRAGMR